MSGLTAPIKALINGLDNNAHSVESYAKIATELPAITQGAHLARGGSSYMSSNTEKFNFTVPEFIEITKRIKLLRERVKLTDDEADELSELGEILQENIGLKTLNKFLALSKQKLIKPLYIAREEAEGALSENSVLHSAIVINPEKSSTYEQPYWSNKPTERDFVYKVPIGAEIYHPGKLADTDEVVLSRGTLNQSKRATKQDYVAAIKKGAALFGVTGITAATLQSEEAEAIPLAQSTLKLTIDALPDDWVMKGQNIPKVLKRNSTPLTGQPLKDEEVDFSGVFKDLDPLKQYTKKDLQAREAVRTDLHPPPTFTDNFKDTFSLKEFDLNNYETKIRRFERIGKSRQVNSHFPNIPDYRGHTRRTIDRLDNEDGRIVFELQSDLFQQGRVAGQTFKEAEELEKLYDSQLLQLRSGDITPKVKKKIDSLEIKKSHNTKQLFVMEQFAQDRTNILHSNTSALFSEINTVDNLGSKYITSEDAMLEVLQSNWPGVIKANQAIDKWTETGSIENYKNLSQVKQFLKQFDKQMDQIYGPQVQSELEKAWNNPDDSIALIKAWNKEQTFFNSTEKKEVFQEQKDLIDLYNQGNATPLQAWLAKRETTMILAIEQKQKQRINKIIDKSEGSIYPKDTPFATNHLEKDLEDELVDAQLSGLKFVAIPLEVGTDTLNRSKSVQRRYETAVRAKMKHTVERLNKDIDQQAIRDGNFELIKNDQGAIQKPNTNPEDYFKYNEVNVPVKQVNTRFDADHLLQEMSEGELLEFARVNNLINPEDLDQLSAHELIINTFEKMSDKEIAKLFVNTDAHTLGKISLPKTKFVPNMQQFAAGQKTVQPKWISNLRLYAATPAGISIPTIHEALQDPEVNAQNLEDFLVNQQGHNREAVQNTIATTMQTKIKDGLDRGLTPEDLVKGMRARGYKREDIERYMPSDDILEVAYGIQKNILFKALMAHDAIRGAFDPTHESFADQTASTIAARAIEANETVERITNNAFAGFSREFAVKAKTQSDFLNQQIQQSLRSKGLEVRVAENGDILVPDSNGTMAPLTVETTDLLLARAYETTGLIGGAIYGGKLGLEATAAAPPLAKGVAAVVGSAIGGALLSSGGRGLDIIKNKVFLKQTIDEALLKQEMINTGAANAVIDLVIPGGIAVGVGVGKVSWRFIKDTYDTFLRGNMVGAHRAMMDLFSIDEKQAFKVMEDWTNIPGNELPYGDKLDGLANQLAILPRTHPGGARLAGLGAQRDNLTSINIAREVDTRAKDLITKASSKDSEVIGIALKDELEKYERRVDELFESTKLFGIKEMATFAPDYSFNFSKLALKPIFERSINSLTNVNVAATAEKMFSNLQQLGGDTSTLRGFTNLLELRKTVNKFGTRKFITQDEDFKMISSIKSRIDKEIATTAKKHMSNGTAWLKQWKAANIAFANKKSVQKNLLFKAIMSKGAQNEQIAKALLKRSTAIDSTFMEVIRMLPPNMRGPMENTVLSSAVDMFTKGKVGEQQAIDFINLANKLNHMSFITPGAKDLKRAINELSTVYKQDPQLLAVAGALKAPSAERYLVSDPASAAEIRTKLTIINNIIDKTKTFFPTNAGRQAALVRNLAKFLRNPLHSPNLDDLINQLPEDPLIRNELQQKAFEVIAWTKKSAFPKVEIFNQTQRGKSRVKVSGPLGKGVYFKLSKPKKNKGLQSNKELIYPKRIADEFVIREVLNLSKDTPITPKLIKEHPKLRQLLEEGSYIGITVSDTVMLF